MQLLPPDRRASSNSFLPIGGGGEGQSEEVAGERRRLGAPRGRSLAVSPLTVSPLTPSPRSCYLSPTSLFIFIPIPHASPPATRVSCATIAFCPCEIAVLGCASPSAALVSLASSDGRVCLSVLHVRFMRVVVVMSCGALCRGPRPVPGMLSCAIRVLPSRMTRHHRTRPPRPRVISVPVS